MHKPLEIPWETTPGFGQQEQKHKMHNQMLKKVIFIQNNPSIGTVFGFIKPLQRLQIDINSIS